MAAHALGEVTSTEDRPRAADALLKALDDDRSEVRAEAAAALAELGDARGRDVLTDALADPERGWDAACSLELLGGLADADALARPLADRKAPPQVQLRAAGALLAIAPAHAQA